MIARTAEKESLAHDGVSWWKEWRGVQERDFFWVEQRYLYRIGPDKVIACQGGFSPVNALPPDLAWERWQQGSNQIDAIREGLGDTSFLEAISLCPEHASEVAALQVARAAQVLRDQLKRNLQAARDRLAEFQATETRLFNKRHGHKTGDEYTKARERTRKRLQPRLDQLEAAILSLIKQLA